MLRQPELLFRRLLPIIKAQGDVSPIGLVVSVDRMERGQGTKSALKEIMEKYGLKTTAIVTMAEVISRRNSRVFCELCSQKTPRGMLPVNSNNMITDEKKNIPQGCPQGVQNHIIHIKTANLRDQLDHFYSQT